MRGPLGEGWVCRGKFSFEFVIVTPKQSLRGARSGSGMGAWLSLCEVARIGCVFLG